MNKKMDAAMRRDTAIQIKAMRRLLRKMGYLKPVKVQTERDRVIKNGRF